MKPRINWGELTEEETMKLVETGLTYLNSEDQIKIYEALKKDIEGE